MTIRFSGVSGGFWGTLACALMVTATGIVADPGSAEAQTFAAQLQAPVATAAPAPAPGKPIAVTPPTLSGPAKPAAAVTEPVAKPDKNRTRFVIGLDKPTEFQISMLANPHRIVVDLPNVSMQLPPDVTANQGGLVKSFYGGLSAPGKAKVVITVADPVVVESQRIETSKDGKTHRLVLELAAFALQSPIA